MFSVVVPAHDEEALIARSLRSMVDGARPDELEVIVVANGCDDGTAARAREVPGPITVIEIDEASKARALQVGDREARAYPRLYVDADVRIDLEGLRSVARRLTREDGVHAAAPTLVVDSSASTWPVRCYYAIWSQLPQVRDSVLGRGVYALDSEGRARFSTFPLVMGDDEYVNGLFAPHERTVVSEAVSVIEAPRSAVHLLRRAVRSASSQLELRREYPDSASGNPRAWVPVVLSSRANLVAGPAYVALTVLARIGARWRRLRGTERRWGSDRSTRVGASADALADGGARTPGRTTAGEA